MKKFLFVVALMLCGHSFAADAPAKPVLKITPGQVIVPTDAMHRIWGELISIDFATRTGKFRKESTDEVMSFTVLPYAELLHHAAFGDLQDFRIGERAIFRMHENDKGEWVWLTYIQDEMNMMNGHKEYFYVDSINADKGQLIVTQANFDKSYVREKEIAIDTDAETHYWKAGQPATFSEIKQGDKLRTRTHGVGKGKTRVAWDVFFDDESLLKFQSAQKAVHAARMKEQGLPGYIDTVTGPEVQLTLFQEGAEEAAKLKPGMKIKVAPAGVDRKPSGESLSATVSAAKMAGKLCKVTVKVSSSTESLQTGSVARLWTSVDSTTPAK